jgi:hypothetical protein
MAKISSFIFLLMLALPFSGCAVAGDIFKAGVWVGIIIVVAVIVLIIFLLRKGSGNS